MTQKPAAPGKVKFKYAIITITILLISLVWWLGAGSNAPADISVKFAGFTNDTAAFVVSNHGNHRFLQSSKCYQFQGDDGLRYGAGPIAASMLSPGQSTTVLVPIPSTNEHPWRIDLFFLVDDWRFWLAMKPPWVKDMVMRIIPVSEERFMVRQVHFASEWLNHEGVTTPKPGTQQFPGIITVPPQTNQNTTGSFSRIDLKL